MRVLRWGLWMAPVINSFLRQSPDPSWYNQDGAVRTGAATVANLFLPAGSFKDWSLSIFTGLLAYDWLRVLIWFDHMGLRVATLVNLTFIGGDRLDESAARFAGHAGRTRIIPEGIRRFATWAPLLIPFYIPPRARLGQGLDGRRDDPQHVAAARDAGLEHGRGLWRGSSVGGVGAAGHRAALERPSRLGCFGTPRHAGRHVERAEALHAVERPHDVRDRSGWPRFHHGRGCRAQQPRHRYYPPSGKIRSICVVLS